MNDKDKALRQPIHPQSEHDNTSDARQHLQLHDNTSNCTTPPPTARVQIDRDDRSDPTVHLSSVRGHYFERLLAFKWLSEAPQVLGTIRGYGADKADRGRHKT